MRVIAVNGFNVAIHEDDALATLIQYMADNNMQAFERMLYQDPGLARQEIMPQYERLPALNNLPKRKSLTLMTLAIMSHHRDGFDIALRFSLNEIDKEASHDHLKGQTPLFLAIKQIGIKRPTPDESHFLRKLLDHGADPMRIASCGIYKDLTALGVAIGRKCITAVDMILEHLDPEIAISYDVVLSHVTPSFVLLPFKNFKRTYDYLEGKLENADKKFDMAWETLSRLIMINRRHASPPDISDMYNMLTQRISEYLPGCLNAANCMDLFSLAFHHQNAPIIESLLARDAMSEPHVACEIRDQYLIASVAHAYKLEDQKDPIARCREDRWKIAKALLAYLAKNRASLQHPGRLDRSKPLTREEQGRVATLVRAERIDKATFDLLGLPPNTLAWPTTSAPYMTRSYHADNPVPNQQRHTGQAAPSSAQSAGVLSPALMQQPAAIRYVWRNPDQEARPHAAPSRQVPAARLPSKPR